MIRSALCAAKHLVGPLGSHVQRATFASGHALNSPRHHLRSRIGMMGALFREESSLLETMSQPKNLDTLFLSRETNISASCLLQRSMAPVTLDLALKDRYRELLSVLEPKPNSGEHDGLHASSTLKKRRLKMNRHKYRKRRKRDRRRSK